jgi:ABC-type sugar transport system permease subunit
MSAATNKAEGKSPSALFSGGYVSRILVRLLGLAILDAFGIWFLYNLLNDGVYYLAVAWVLVLLFNNVVFLREDAYPLRWMAIGLSAMGLLAIYPIVFTVYTAFTNYGDGHLLSKTQAIRQIERQRYLPEGGLAYAWVAYQTPEGEFALWLNGEGGESFLAHPDGRMEELTAGQGGVGQLDEDGFPVSIEGYTRLTTPETMRSLRDLSGVQFGSVEVRSIREAAQLQPLYVYDEAQDAMVNQETGLLYYNQEGTFTAEDGSIVRPGFQVVTGFDNFARVFTNPNFRGPIIRVFIWTVVFAFLTVLTTFALGLSMALVFESDVVPIKKFWRSLLIIPYAIPAVISVFIWRGLFNPNLGVINQMLEAMIGFAPSWFSEPFWARVAIIFINLWLGYPYMMLICSGALQAIPQDMYEAAEVDGANGWQKFWYLTLPMLLVAVGPLLIASFTFNFNNFNVIYLFNSGGPPVPNSPTPAGYTDILLTYTYRLAFEGGRGADYGFASAITIIIFVVLVVITLFNFRFTSMWEEVGENV